MTEHISIRGSTRLVGLLGWPVEHSLSPALHNAAFEAMGLDWRYVPLPVHPSRIEDALRGLAALGFVGANVTVPHKQAVLPHLSGVSPHAQKLGAVNTIVVARDETGRAILEGLNTDDAGFVRALRAAEFESGGCRALVLGAGGAARAVVAGLLGAGATDVVVLNRTLDRAEALVADLRSFYPGIPLTPGPLAPETLADYAPAADLLVNATSLGMWPRAEASPWPKNLTLPAHLAVFDLIYRPRRTRLLRQAEAAGARTIDGLGMLVHQAALSFEMWTDQWPPLDAMWTAATEQLKD